MKFTCSQAALSKAVSIVTKAISVRTTIPILKGILLEAKENKLTLTCSNLDLTVVTTAEINCSEEGSIVIDAKLFSEVLRRLPNAIASIEAQGNTLKLTCLGSEFSFICFNAEEYPSTGSVDEIKKFSVNKKDFCDLIKKTSFAACIDEKKGILIGCLIDFLPDKIEMVALDGFRMAIARHYIEDGNGVQAKIVIPARMLSDINKLLLEDGEETIDISIDEKKLQIVSGDTIVMTRLLVGDFINYRDILPAEHRTRLTISRQELQASLERASLFAREGQNNLIKFNVDGNFVKIDSKSEEGFVNEQVSCETEGNDSLSIGFNSKYILDVLKSVDDEDVVFDLIDKDSCCLIKPADGDEFIYFILPVRIISVR